MAKLSYGERKKMKKSTFALPGKREGGKGGYPIPDRSHAANALSRVSQFGSPSEKATVRAKVHAKYPSMGKMHAGGMITQDGMYEMKKGEMVTPAKSMSGHWEIDGASRKWVAEGGKCSCC